eukprot:5978127-Amphidinium_carterae.1
MVQQNRMRWGPGANLAQQVYRCYGNIKRCAGGPPGKTCANGRVGLTCAVCKTGTTPSADESCQEPFPCRVH